MAYVTWPESYETVIKTARKYALAKQFTDATRAYLRAARIAPTFRHESIALEWAFYCNERDTQGRLL